MEKYGGPHQRRENGEPLSLWTGLAPVQPVPGGICSGGIDYVWRLRGTVAATTRETLLGDGRTDLIFDLAGGDKARVFIAGAFDRGGTITLNGSVDLLGVRFTPLGFQAWSGTPGIEVANRAVPLAVFNSLWHDSLADEVFCAAERSRITALARFLKTRQSDKRRACSPVYSTQLASLVRFLDDAEAGVKARALKDRLAYSHRHLERRFKACVGIGIHGYLRLKRIKRLIVALHHGDRGSPPGTAAGFYHQHGYCDQSHAIGELKHFTGCTPSTFNLDHFPMQALFLKHSR